MLAAETPPDVVVHPAAQAGVGYAPEHPTSDGHTNILATSTLPEACSAHPDGHLLMPSTRSAYGAMPFRETYAVATPLNIDAAPRMACETIGHSYAHLWHRPITMVRFLVVHGAWGRPDLAFFRITGAMLRGRPIDTCDPGRMKRDSTHVDDKTEATDRLLPRIPAAGPAVAPCDSISPMVDIGNAQPVQRLDCIAEIDRACGRTAIRNPMDMQPGEVLKTWADARLLKAPTGYGPGTGMATGVAESSPDPGPITASEPLRRPA